jgi:hypothetical protein
MENMRTDDGARAQSLVHAMETDTHLYVSLSVVAVAGRWLGAVPS